MAKSLTQVVAERKKALRALKASLKKADTALEATERLLNRLINRKRSLPETTDLAEVGHNGKKIEENMGKFLADLQTAERIFTE